jgi:hypothetical protein
MSPFVIDVIRGNAVLAFHAALEGAGVVGVEATGANAVFSTTSLIQYPRNASFARRPEACHILTTSNRITVP